LANIMFRRKLIAVSVVSIVRDFTGRGSCVAIARGAEAMVVKRYEYVVIFF